MGVLEEWGCAHEGVEVLKVLEEWEPCPPTCVSAGRAGVASHVMCRFWQRPGAGGRGQREREGYTQTSTHIEREREGGRERKADKLEGTEGVGRKVVMG